jgi:hypothetical protein
MKWKHFIMVYIICQCIVQFLASLVVQLTTIYELLRYLEVPHQCQECPLLHAVHIKFSIDHVFTLYLYEVPVINSVMPVCVKRSFQVVSQVLCNRWICPCMLVLLSKISFQKYMKQTNCEVAH